MAIARSSPSYTPRCARCAFVKQASATLRSLCWSVGPEDCSAAKARQATIRKFDWSLPKNRLKILNELRFFCIGSLCEVTSTMSCQRYSPIVKRRSQLTRAIHAGRLQMMLVKGLNQESSRRLFVDIARNLARRRVGAALHFERTCIAVEF
jgi:hypothetical protein